MRDRAHQIIPAGAHTYSKGDDQFPEDAPPYIVRGSGSHVWDLDGNEFVDWGMGLRSVILGHAYPPVLDAVRRELDRGSNFTRPAPIEVEFAETLVGRIPSAEMVKFAKNGSDVTTAAIRLARAYTGRDYVIACGDHPFFSVNDWFIGSTAIAAGVPQAIRDLTLRFKYNDLASLEAAFAAHPGQVAAVILEPMHLEAPAPDFLEGVRDIAKKHGAIFILDEIITGFRWHARGAQSYYGVTPDLSTFGKAIGNGFSVSALVGRRDIMERGGLHHDKERVFLLSTTHGGETHALAAACATVHAIEDAGVVPHVWEIGKRLQDGIAAAIAAEGLAASATVIGMPCSPAVTFVDPPDVRPNTVRTIYLQELIADGILMPWIAPSLAHTEDDVDRTVRASARALRLIRDGLRSGDIARLLRGAPTKPVFRRYN